MADETRKRKLQDEGDENVSYKRHKQDDEIIADDDLRLAMELFEAEERRAKIEESEKAQASNTQPLDELQAIVSLFLKVAGIASIVRGLCEGEEIMSREQAEAYAVFQSGRNVAVTGSGGKGKSWLFRKMAKEAIEKYGRHAVAITSTTGISAVNVGGVTVHNFFQLRQDQIRNRSPQIRNVWRNLKVLMVDELSMMPPFLWKLLHRQACNSRPPGEGETHNKRHPFAGVQVVAFFDFLQLPWIKDDGEDEEARAGEFDHVFDDPLWKSMFSEPQGTTIELLTNFRHKDTEFCELMDRVRVGEVTKEDIVTLRTTVNNFKDEDEDHHQADELACGDDSSPDDDHDAAKAPGVTSTKLFPFKKRVHAINTEKLADLPGEVYSYLRTAEAENDGAKNRRFPQKDEEKYIDQVLKNMQIPEQLDLKDGAQVMLVANLAVNRGLANGTRGVVTGRDAANGFPIVRFAEGQQCTVQPYTWTSNVYGGRVYVTGIPLILAWSLTIHKSQGSTIAPITVDCSGCHEDGQFYVAVSRTTALQHLRLRNFNSGCIRTDKQVVEYYKNLRKEMEQKYNVRPSAASRPCSS